MNRCFLENRFLRKCAFLSQSFFSFIAFLIKDFIIQVSCSFACGAFLCDKNSLMAKVIVVCIRFHLIEAICEPKNNDSCKFFYKKICPEQFNHSACFLIKTARETVDWCFQGKQTYPLVPKIHFPKSFPIKI